MAGVEQKILKKKFQQMGVWIMHWNGAIPEELLNQTQTSLTSYACRKLKLAMTGLVSEGKKRPLQKAEKSMRYQQNVISGGII